MGTTSRRVPLRMCLGCREMKPKADLLRVVRTEDHTLEYDPTSKKNGRGAYLCRKSDCLAKAIKSRSFSKALGSEPNADMFEMLKKAGMNGE
ncbi:MAG: YlxR family protein [Peptococcaceae bacterium]|nr:YlxR family protein [Peptococcaceae bacterium]